MVAVRRIKHLVQLSAVGLVILTFLIFIQWEDISYNTRFKRFGLREHQELLNDEELTALERELDVDRVLKKIQNDVLSRIQHKEEKENNETRKEILRNLQQQNGNDSDDSTSTSFPSASNPITNPVVTQVTPVSKRTTYKSRDQRNRKKKASREREHRRHVKKFKWKTYPWGPRMRGQLNVHVWQAWCGNTIHDLRRNWFFPSYPDLHLTVRRFYVQHYEDDYGQRIFGYIHPPLTGKYIFALSSDDSSELWLSKDEHPENIKLISWVGNLTSLSGAHKTNIAEFTKYNTQLSRQIYLKKGQRYFVEALHKQGTRDDHILVGWKIPGLPGFRYITGDSISMYIDDDNASTDVTHYARYIPQTLPSHIHSRTWSVVLDREIHKFGLNNEPDIEYHNRKVELKSFDNILPNCTYDPSYLVNFTLRRYDGVKLIHDSAVYPNDYTILTHMRPYDHCLGRRSTDSHGNSLNITNPELSNNTLYDEGIIKAFGESSVVTTYSDLSDDYPTEGFLDGDDIVGRSSEKPMRRLEEQVKLVSEIYNETGDLIPNQDDSIQSNNPRDSYYGNDYQINEQIQKYDSQIRNAIMSKLRQPSANDVIPKRERGKNGIVSKRATKPPFVRKSKTNQKTSRQRKKSHSVKNNDKERKTIVKTDDHKQASQRKRNSRKGRVESVRKDSHIVRNDRRAVDKDSRTVRKDSRSVRKDSRTVRKDSRSVRKDSRTVRKDSRTVRKDGESSFTSNTRQSNSQRKDSPRKPVNQDSHGRHGSEIIIADGGRDDNQRTNQMKPVEQGLNTATLRKLMSYSKSNEQRNQVSRERSQNNIDEEKNVEAQIQSARRTYDSVPVVYFRPRGTAQRFRYLPKFMYEDAILARLNSAHEYVRRMQRVVQAYQYAMTGKQISDQIYRRYGVNISVHGITPYMEYNPWIYHHNTTKCTTDGNILLNENVAKSVVSHYMKELENKIPNTYTLKKIINVQENHDVLKGDRYLMELELFDLTKGHSVRLSQYIYQKIGQTHFCLPHNFQIKHHATVHVIVPVKNQGRWVQYFIDDMSELYLKTGDPHLNVIIVDFSSDDIDVEEALKRSALVRYRVITLTGPFQRAFGIQAGAAIVRNPDDIIFMCDLHLELPNNMISIIRKHCIQDKMAFAPIVTRLHCGFTPTIPYGFWELQGYGLFAMYKSDFSRVGGMNYREFGTRWGGEDWELLDRVLLHKMEVERLRIPNFYHFYHSKKGMWGSPTIDTVSSDISAAYYRNRNQIIPLYVPRARMIPLNKRPTYTNRQRSLRSKKKPSRVIRPASRIRRGYRPRRVVNPARPVPKEIY